MKIVKAGYEILTPVDAKQILEHLERCGRVCYKSEDKITENSAEKFLRGIIRRGHKSVLEHASFTVRFIVDRGVSHEIVRSRLASYSQESTRYCNYGDGRFQQEITVVLPPSMDGKIAYTFWYDSCKKAEVAYFDLLDQGYAPQIARSVLPNSLKTEVIMTANIREWRHFLKLRTAPEAHPQMREVTIPLLEELQMRLPVLFEDISEEAKTQPQSTDYIDRHQLLQRIDGSERPEIYDGSDEVDWILQCIKEAPRC